MSAYVSFENVSKIYRTGEVEIQALHEVNFQIEKGEFCVIVGVRLSGYSYSFVVRVDCKRPKARKNLP